MPDVEAVKIVVTLAVSHVAITTSGILLHLRKDCIVKADVTIGSGLATRTPNSCCKCRLPFNPKSNRSAGPWGNKSKGRKKSK